MACIVADGLCCHRIANMINKMGPQFYRGGILMQLCSRSGIMTGRLTALQRADGGVRGIVAGDILRRIVARTIA